jgi:hypothetical protein
MAFEWPELTYQQILAGSTALRVFPICVLLTYLVLATKYESLFLPMAVILIVALCLLSAMCGVWISKDDDNIFTPDRPCRVGGAGGQERDRDRRVVLRMLGKRIMGRALLRL